MTNKNTGWRLDESCVKTLEKQGTYVFYDVTKCGYDVESKVSFRRNILGKRKLFEIRVRIDRNDKEIANLLVNYYAKIVEYQYRNNFSFVKALDMAPLRELENAKQIMKDSYGVDIDYYLKRAAGLNGGWCG